MTVRRKASIAPLTANEQEAANRAEATALLIRSGYRVYKPEVDSYGEDLVLRTPKGHLRAVQLKSRPTVDLSRYGGKRYGGVLSIWMLFPDPKSTPASDRQWYLIAHDELFKWIKARHGRAPKWSGYWHYPDISKELRAFLHRHRIRSLGDSN